ncbi:MAG: hypothetical protein ACIAQU_03220 [Phycisphaerales bacterium JB064]
MVDRDGDSIFLSLESNGLPVERWSELPSLMGSSQSNWKLNACIGKQLPDDIADYTYADGYRKAAELIAMYVDQAQINVDTLVYPFVFNWRHHFELVLKHMVQLAAELHDEEPGDLAGHHLVPLWQRLKPYILKRWPNAGTEVPDRCEELVRALDRLDQSGQTFRYSANRQGKRHLEEEMRLNIADFNLVAASLANFFSGILTQFDVDLDQKRAWQAELGDDR